MMLLDIREVVKIYNLGSVWIFTTKAYIKVLTFRSHRDTGESDRSEEFTRRTLGEEKSQVGSEFGAEIPRVWLWSGMLELIQS